MDRRTFSALIVPATLAFLTPILLARSKTLPRMVNEASRKKDKLRRIDKAEQRAGRMAPYEIVAEDELKESLTSLGGPIYVNGCYIACIHGEDHFKDGQEFLENSNFLKFADALAISKGVSGAPLARRDYGSGKREDHTGRMKKISLRWHMPGDKSFFAMHPGGPGYDAPSHRYMDVFSLFDRVLEVV